MSQESTNIWKFRNKQLFEESMTHSSYANENPKQGPSNERLEFIGDAVMDLLSAQMLFRLFPRASEGELTQRRTRIVCQAAFAKFAKDLSLEKHLKLGQGLTKNSLNMQARILADTFEALAGAVFLDGGFEAVEQCFGQIVEKAIQHIESPLDYKSQLQELCHQLGVTAPTYRILDTLGPDHDLEYICEVTLSGSIRTIGKASSKKAAEQICARKALTQLVKTDDRKSK